ncbi:MAG: efflux RND transporter periplasmic adaptor subunit [Terracidiphilus sp.]|jgi:RND family efflux transporter MFP subunit
MTQEPNPHSQPAAASHETAPEATPLSPRKAMVGVAVVLLILLVLAAVGILRRMHAGTVLAQRTYSLAAPTVSIAPAKAGAPVETLVLPGNVTAYTDSPIYARTDGYLDRWYYDIGAKVKKGALLAVISTPELDKQVAQAESDLATAEANANNARTQADRYSGLVKSNAVSQQDTDTYVSQAAATASTVKSAEANLQRLRELQSFEKVYAPFDGVVTARAVDTGQLISSGSAGGAGTELFHMQALQTLRVYTNVPQLYSQTMKHGMKIGFTFPEYPGKTFEGTLVRTADAIDPVSRTLLVEIDLDNRSGQLMPGALAQVHFKAPSAGPAYIVPASAIIFRREGMQVATVTDGSDGTVAHLIPVVIGEDDGATVQIVSGLNPGDRVIQDPPDSLINNEKVTVESSQSSAFGAGGL